MAKTRKLYTKIKNFTEKDQVRIKYSYIGKDKKLMLSVYIGEEVYKALTGGQEFKRLKVEYIPNDMVIITPTDNEKEGIVHRYNGKGLFKTTCVRLSLSSYKKLKISKKNFNNRVVGYLFASRSDGKCLNVDLIGDKRKSKFIHDNAIREIINLDNIVPQDYVSKSKIKPLEIRASHADYMPDREYLEDYFLKKFETHITGTFATRLNILEENVKFLSNAVEINVSATQPKELDIDTLKQLFGNITDAMNFKLSKVEKEIVELVSKTVDINCRLNLLLQKLEDKTADPEYMFFRFMEIKDLLNQIKKSHEHKSLFEKIFGKDCQHE